MDCLKAFNTEFNGVMDKFKKRIDTLEVLKGKEKSLKFDQVLGVLEKELNLIQVTCLLSFDF